MRFERWRQVTPPPNCSFLNTFFRPLLLGDPRQSHPISLTDQETPRGLALLDFSSCLVNTVILSFCCSPALHLLPTSLLNTHERHTLPVCVLNDTSSFLVSHFSFSLRRSPPCPTCLQKRLSVYFSTSVR